MDPSLRASSLLKGDIESMPADTVNEELNLLAHEATEFMPECDECSDKHGQEIISVDDGKIPVSIKKSVILVPSGVLVIQTMRTVKGSSIIAGHTQRANIRTLSAEGFEVRDVFNAMFLFVEQEKMLKMCTTGFGQIRSALA